MNVTRIYAFLLLTLLLGSVCGGHAAVHPALLPTPRSVVWGNGSFSLQEREKIASDAPAEVNDFVSQLEERTGSVYPLAEMAPIQFRLLKVRREDLGDEGYRIAVTKKDVSVEANTATGLYYGSLTLRQIVQVDGKRWSVPVVTVEDWPAMPYRGVMVDISRGLVPNLATFERMIKWFAEMKINAVQPYIEDTFAFKSYPFIGRDRGAWTPEEVQQMVAVAQKYHVDLSPCFESLGHMGQILKHPEVADLRETGDVITPAKEASYDFLRTCYGELSAAFPFPYLNVGCDETGGLGQGPSKPMAQKDGVGKVYSSHLQRLDALCHEVHRKMQFWGDMMVAYPGIVADMPKDAIVMNWDYGTHENFRNIGVYKGFGYQQIVCPGIESWSSMFTDVNSAEPNIRGFIKEGKAAGALGVLNTGWRDDGEVFFDYDWYADAIGAECSWAVTPAEGPAFDAAFENAFFGAHSSGLARAYRAMSDSLTVQGSHVGGGAMGLYYSDPFKDLSPAARTRGQISLQRLAGLAKEIRQAASQAAEHPEVLPYLRFAADRIAFIPGKYDLAWKIANAYADAVEASNATSIPQSTGASVDVKQIGDNHFVNAAMKLRGAIDSLRVLEAVTLSLQKQYGTLWMGENKQPGLQNVLDRYAQQLKSYAALEDRLKKALADLQTGKPLPSAAAMGVALPSQTASGYRIPSPMAAAAGWAPAGTLAIQVHLPDALLQPVPLQLEVKPGVLPANIPRLARLRTVDAGGKELTSTACQVDAIDPAHTVLTFMVPAGSQGDLNFVLDPTPATTPDTVSVSPAAELKDGLWITTGRYRSLLGSQGAHLFRWDAAALTGQDVTVPGDDDWHGFDDVGGERQALFSLKPLLRGPLCVQIQCDAADGFRKTLTFYAGMGWYETRFDSPVDFFWHYDDPGVMGSSSPTPGSYRFSDGKTGVLPAESAPSEAEAGAWVAKYRPDGWTLGLISPDDHPVLRAGPGGSMGGVGVEGGGATSHLLTYADVTPGNWKTISDLSDSYTRLQKATVAVR